MTGLRIVHAADIHLDSPLRGVRGFAGEDLAQQLRTASRRAFVKLVDLVVRERADALVLAGDIYDGDWVDYATGRFFAQQMGVLHDHGIKVFMVAGNHDAESVVTKAVRLPDNVTVLSTAEVQTETDDNLGLVVHGQGFATKAVTENLVLSYPDRRQGYVNVGILHTAVTGAEGHDRYAPCTPQDLANTEYDYFALGHVHSRRVVNDGHRVAAFSGNLQGRHANETGPKGALVVDLAADERATVRFEPLDVARWEHLRVDATDLRTFDDVLTSVQQHVVEAQATAGDRPLVARVTVFGATPAAGALTDRERLTEEVSSLASAKGVTVEKVRSRATSPRRAGPVDPQVLDAILQRGQELALDVDRLREFAKPLDRDFGRILRKGTGLDLNDADTLARISEAAVAALIAKLSAGES